MYRQFLIQTDKIVLIFTKVLKNISYSEQNYPYPFVNTKLNFNFKIKQNFSPRVQQKPRQREVTHKIQK